MNYEKQSVSLQVSKTMVRDHWRFRHQGVTLRLLSRPAGPVLGHRGLSKTVDGLPISHIFTSWLLRKMFPNIFLQWQCNHSLLAKPRWCAKQL
jgi:hypothetical protein